MIDLFCLHDVRKRDKTQSTHVVDVEGAIIRCGVVLIRMGNRFISPLISYCFAVARTSHGHSSRLMGRMHNNFDIIGAEMVIGQSQGRRLKDGRDVILGLDM